MTQPDGEYVSGNVVGARAVLLAGGVGIALTGLLWAGLPSLRQFGSPTRVEGRRVRLSAATASRGGPRPGRNPSA